jgi:Phage integrase, N-terminal
MNKKTPRPESKVGDPTDPNMSKVKGQAQTAINPKAKHSGNWKTSWAQVLAEHNRFNADGTTASAATQDKYADVLYAGFNALRDLGYKLCDVQGFRGKHMEALAHHWEQQCRESKLSPATVQNQMSIFRRFSVWIGKDGMVEDSNKYVSPEYCSRTTINAVDKSWPVDAEIKLTSRAD